MTRTRIFAGVLAIVAAAPALAVDAQRREQAAALEARRAGKSLSVREIERRVLPTMSGARYIGFDFDSGSGIYTLKFLRNGQVIWVDVDGQSGQVLGSTGR